MVRKIYLFFLFVLGFTLLFNQKTEALTVSIQPPIVTEYSMDENGIWNYVGMLPGIIEWGSHNAYFVRFNGWSYGGVSSMIYVLGNFDDDELFLSAVIRSGWETEYLVSPSIPDNWDTTLYTPTPNGLFKTYVFPDEVRSVTFDYYQSPENGFFIYPQTSAGYTQDFTITPYYGASSSPAGSFSLGASLGWPVKFNVGDQPAPVPEPATMILLGSGLIGLAGFRRKFRKR